MLTSSGEDSPDDDVIAHLLRRGPAHRARHAHHRVFTMPTFAEFVAEHSRSGKTREADEQRASGGKGIQGQNQGHALQSNVACGQLLKVVSQSPNVGINNMVIRATRKICFFSDFSLLDRFIIRPILFLFYCDFIQLGLLRFLFPYILYVGLCVFFVVYVFFFVICNFVCIAFITVILNTPWQAI